MQHDWGNTAPHTIGNGLQPSGREGLQVYASTGARAEFEWLVDKMPEWAGHNIVLITELDITGGIDSSELSEEELDKKVETFTTANPSVFKDFTTDSLKYFTNNAKYFAQHGADCAQGFKLSSSEFSSILFIQNIRRRDFAQATQEYMGRAIHISPFDDAAMTIMHECGHILKQHSHDNQTDANANETEAESLMKKIYIEAIDAGYNLNPESLQTRLACRSLESLLFSTHREIGDINNPLGPKEGRWHNLNVGLSLIQDRLTGKQAEALLKAPIQINTLTQWLTDDKPGRSHYFSAMAVLHSSGYLGSNTIAEIYAHQGLEACRTYAPEWIEEQLMVKFTEKLRTMACPNVEWDRTNDFFQPPSTQPTIPDTQDLDALETHI